MLATKNGIGLINGDIRNAFFTAPLTESIWSTCGQEFGAIFDAVVFLKRALYGLKTSFN